MLKSRMMAEILKVLEGHETFLISSHTNPDGDSIGSQLALYSLLSGLRKKALVIDSDPVPFAYSFLPNANVLREESTLHVKGPELKAQDARHQDFESISDIEVAIILDCGNLNRIGEKLAAQIYPKQAVINIDHHRTNDRFGTHNLVDAGACATAEIIFRLMEDSGIEIGQDRAECLYTAIITDTGCFRYANTTAEAHRIAARLIDEGACPDQIARSVYEVIPYQRARLFGMALETLKLSPDGKIAWVSVTNEMHTRSGTEDTDTEGFIDYVRSIRNAEIAILFRETSKGDIRVSLRSKGQLVVDEVAAAFGGGGHRAAAGCSISETLDKAIALVLEAVTSSQIKNQEDLLEQ